MRYLALLVLIGCGGGTSGEPMMGNVTVSYGSSSPKMVVGSAVPNMDNANEMLVQIGSDNSISTSSGPGQVTISVVDARVMGTVTFATVDEDVGNIMVAGSFDVKKCF